MKKPKIREIINKHRCHYLKWDITDDLSVRYHFTFQDRRNFERQYCLKSHNSKTWSIIDEKMAEAIISEHNLNYIEIMGQQFENNYMKQVISRSGEVDTLIEDTNGELLNDSNNENINND